jgi:hypothetical protein
MERLYPKRRLVQPVAAAFCLLAASWLIYNIAWHLAGTALHQALASMAGPLLFISIVIAPPVVYAVALFRGASATERIAAALVNPFLWATKESLRLLISFSPAEAFYYYFNPLNIWLLLGIIALLGFTEIACRWRMVRLGEPVTVFTPVPIAAFIVGLFLAISLFSWGQGEGLYVIFLAGYRVLFGAGV